MSTIPIAITYDPLTSISGITITARRFYIMDRAQIKAKADIQKEEDAAIFAAINACITDEERERMLIEQARTRVKNSIFELEV
jgi:hypothetical protein